jgi:hypothetical protein
VAGVAVPNRKSRVHHGAWPCRTASPASITGGSHAEPQVPRPSRGVAVPNRKSRVHHGGQPCRTASPASITGRGRAEPQVPRPRRSRTEGCGSAEPSADVQPSVGRSYGRVGCGSAAEARRKHAQAAVRRPRPATSTRRLRFGDRGPPQARASCGSAPQTPQDTPVTPHTTPHTRPSRTRALVGAAPDRSSGSPLADIGHRTRGVARVAAAHLRRPPQPPEAHQAASSSSSTASAVTGRGLG